ncbi:type II toxin-antitoxin system HicA family toxin [Pseudomonas sp. RC4D1]|uniref:type II toxin-antitoxin system HicA family toxin n=1 Tax=Pseudomonas sp. RC4D1 TaxID=2834407 RepID=UPI001BCEB9A5|nr:type II toxin-antitoxin system HicA family toxin [Pseudomonas sp. RC4D1]MBS7560124.1 type II toxin-antitoxin system HicA family toxin [Pseudomonas sp. RC4D1]
MSNAHELAQGNERLLPLIEHALTQGWSISRSPNGCLTFLKPGLPAIYTRPTKDEVRIESNQKIQAVRSDNGSNNHG